MASTKMLWLLLSCFLTTSTMADDLKLLMPNVQPKRNDTYLCHEVKLKDTLYITGFKPKANMNEAHHILVYGCAEPNGFEEPWQCGEMQSNSNDFEVGPVCKSESNIIYAWGMDAPELKLPDDVAFKVGGKSGVRSLVVQVHYKDVSHFQGVGDKKDNSGVVLTTTTTPRGKTAGVFLLGTAGEIPAHSTTYMETACEFDQPLTLHPFAFRAHAHEHGQVVSGYRVRDGKWTEIGRISPQKPQMFYPVTNPDITVKTGDILAARCTMVNTENRAINIGATVKDEMCNFYMMYYVDGDHLVKDPMCFSAGPPSWKWRDVEGIKAENAPQSASLVPDTDTILKESRNNFGNLEKAITSQINHHRQMMNDHLMKMQKLNNFKTGDDLDKSYKLRNDLWDRPFLREDDPEEEPPYDDFNFRSFANHPWGSDNINEPSFVDQFNIPSMSDISDLSIPDISSPDTSEETSESDKAKIPIETESISLIDDKHGGKGFQKTKHIYKNLDGPGTKGFYSETKHESQYNYNSNSANENQNE